MSKLKNKILITFALAIVSVIAFCVYNINDLKLKNQDDVKVEISSYLNEKYKIKNKDYKIIKIIDRAEFYEVDIIYLMN